MKKINIIAFCISVFLCVSIFSNSQQVKTIDGIQVIHNEKGGKRGTNPEVSIKLIRTIGDVNATDENLAFNLPWDIAFDDAGSLYILDSGNHRIQKFSPDAKYLGTFGRQGQGPAEFVYPESLDIDSAGYLYVLDPLQNRIQLLTPEGEGDKSIRIMNYSINKIRCLKSGLLAAKGTPPLSELETKDKNLLNLIKLLDQKGNIQKEFADMFDYGDNLTNSHANTFDFDIDKNGNFYLSFIYQNRIEKYSPDSKLLWKADRILNYSTEIQKKGKMERSGVGVSISAPQMNKCSNGIAVDEKGRVWVVTLSRQLKKDEIVFTSTGVMRSNRAMTQVRKKVEGNTDLQVTDAYKLEIFAPDGVLLGEIPLNHFVDGIRIHKDSLFLLDKERGAKYYQYKIVDK
jgi:sugar lactone lactonase YvrE